MVLFGRVHHVIVFGVNFGPFVLAFDRIRALHERGKRLDYCPGELLFGC
jgi:hypothetical protein